MIILYRDHYICQRIFFNNTIRALFLQGFFMPKTYGSLDCFTFAIDFLNGKLDGDLKRKPEGEDDDERFEDLKKGRN